MLHTSIIYKFKHISRTRLVSAEVRKVTKFMIALKRTSVFIQNLKGMNEFKFLEHWWDELCSDRFTQSINSDIVARVLYVKIVM
jgi:hypothetical protein